MLIESNEEKGGVSKTMDFGVKLFFFPLLVINQVILERGLNPLIISISVPLFPWHNLRNVVVRPPEVASVVHHLRIFVCLLPFKFHLLHLCRKRFHHLGQFIHLRVRHRGVRG
jgi:hypothetical protein